MVSDGTRVEVKPPAELTTLERERLDALIGSVFGAAVAELRWADTDWHVLIWAKDQLVSHCEIVGRTVHVGDRPIWLGGIGGVATAAEWRGRGLASAALRTAAAFMRDQMNVEFGLLITGESIAPFYQRLGWQVVKAPLTFDQPLGKVTSTGVTMVLPYSGRQWPEGAIDLCGLPC